MPASAAGLWPRRAASIRARLLFWLSVPLVFFLAVDAWASYRATLASIQLAYDRLLVTSAHAIADLIRLDRGQLVIGLPHAALEIYDHPLAADDQPLARGRMLYRVGFVDGTHLAGDAELQPYAGRPDSHPIYRSMIELYDATHGAEPMRVAALLQPVESYDGGRLVVVQVAEVSVYRDILARRVLYDTLQRQAALLAVVLVLIWTVSTIALRQLHSLAQHLNTRAAHDLAPLPFPRAPLELRPLVEGFNGLLFRLGQAREQQRRFVADASHQLRTPLTVLQLQADAGLRGDIPAQDALASVATTARRATNLAEQLLSLARAHQTAHGEPAEPVDLRALASEVAVELSPLVSGKFLDFHFDCAPIQVFSHPWMLREIVSNLLRNAIEFTPVRGSLGIRIEDQGRGARLVVWDSGPGLSDAMKDHVFKPFASGRPSHGVGLGLAICKELADALGVGIDLLNTEPPPGLEARVTFPRERHR